MGSSIKEICIKSFGILRYISIRISCYKKHESYKETISNIELYNEPYLKKGEFDTYYAGDDTYVGMKEMYDVVRKNDPDGLIIIAGMVCFFINILQYC